MRHMLGLGDIDAPINADHLMAGTLATGVAGSRDLDCANRLPRDLLGLPATLPS